MSFARYNQSKPSFFEAYRRHILFSLYAFIVFFVLGGGSFLWNWMEKPTSFPIKTIELSGQLNHETPKQLEQVIQTTFRGDFFSMNTSAIRAELMQFPWIQSVAFRRLWPSTLVVHIVEQQPVARFGFDGVMNTAGVIFHPEPKSIPANLPQLIGDPTQAETLFNLFNTLNAQTATLKLSVIALQVNKAQNTVLTLSNQVKVVLGSSDVLPRYQRFLAVYPKILTAAIASHRTIALVDLRYPNGMAVRYAGELKSAKNNLKTQFPFPHPKHSALKNT